MRILILGTNYAALKFGELFEKNKSNDIFSMFSHSKNYMDFKTNQDILDFCLANDINLVVSTQEDFTTTYLTEELSENNITVFSPSIDAIEISSSKVFAYRFMHKNSIPSAKFFIAEKVSSAMDFIKNSNFPIAIKPDNHSYQEGVLFAETLSDAVKITENFFNTGNKKILLQDYVDGKNITVWTISDGYQAKILSVVAKYRNNIAYSKPELISQELKNKIQETIINPTIKALMEEEREYAGIFGFDIIIDKNENPIVVGYNSFFDDISVEFFTQNKNCNWEEIFESTITGTLFLKDIIPENENYMLTIREEGKINFFEAKTKTNLFRIIEQTDSVTEDLKEAELLWKM